MIRFVMCWMLEKNDDNNNNKNHTMIARVCVDYYIFRSLLCNRLSASNLEKQHTKQ